MSGFFDRLLDLLYPTRCIVCRTPLSPGRPRLCPACMGRVPAASRTSVPYISECVSACLYENETAEAIRRFKFGGCQAYAHAFSELVAARIYEELWGKYDVLSWVPLSADRKRSRGYDQTQLIASKTAKRLRQPLVSTLKKKKGVSQQSKAKGIPARRANILGAYSAPDPSLVAGKRVLLIDDIVTSGATLAECAKTLRFAGAEDVLCATLAKTPETHAP